MGVVVHVDEAGDDKHESVLRNVANLLNELGDGTPVEIVAHGPGIDLCLPDSSTADSVRSLLARGVIVAACENTMRSRAIAPEALTPGVVTVSAGIAELVRKQRDGWAYVRP